MGRRVRAGRAERRRLERKRLRADDLERVREHLRSEVFQERFQALCTAAAIARIPIQGVNEVRQVTLQVLRELGAPVGAVMLTVFHDPATRRVGWNVYRR